MSLLTELFAESEDTTANGKRIHADVLIDDAPLDSPPPEPPPPPTPQ